MQRPGSHEAALAKFRAGEVQVLVGTQMIAKGLDFPNVTLVGVINADTALHLPDFRASERTFQLVTQVAGRTGRGDRPGRVLVQTFAPDHPAIQAAIQHDYIRFATQELPIRKLHRYPPTTQLVRIVLRGENQQQLTHFAESLTQQIHAGCKALGMHLDSGLSSIAPPSHLPSSNSSGSTPQAWLRTLGPAPCPIEKLRGKFRMHLLLTTESFPLLKSVLKEVQENLPSSEEIQWIVDVDPHDML
ncbi:MAG: helicase-related protein [Pirellulales bacterium]